MKDHLKGLLRVDASRGVVREYLQARILESLQHGGAMIPLAFHGGTALRFLYRIPRWSEDLDFALERTPAAYDLRGWLGRIQSTFAAEGYDVDIRLNDRRTVHAAFVRFRGLLREIGLAAQAAEVLAIKIEVDTRPPAGATLDTTLVRRHVLLQFQHHDRASLLAGKIHAILARPYAKGRDLYDLLWYLSAPDWPAPNLELLENALRRTGHGAASRIRSTWRATIRRRLDELDWKRVASDVRPFLEVAGDTDLLTRENLVRLLQPRPGRRRPARPAVQS